MQELVISAIGADRPGLVDELTAALFEHEANIADSRMINLRGRFAVVMLIEAPDERAAEVRSAVAEAAQRIGLTAAIHDAAEPPRSAVRAGVPYRVRTYAMDQVGLVHRITHVLHVLGVNIEELNTRLEHAPHSGAPLFSMDMVVTLPKDVPLQKVRHELESLCAELNCDLDIDRG